MNVQTLKIQVRLGPILNIKKYHVIEKMAVPFKMRVDLKRLKDLPLRGK